MSHELHKKYRPRLLKEVVGQPDAIRVIAEFLRAGRFPHSILLSGPSGTGKTSIARILKGKLKCSDRDFREMNCGMDGGVDVIRALSAGLGLAPLGGQSRIFLLDECFFRDTLVSAPEGRTRIDSVSSGDRIYSLGGTTRVLRVFRNPVHVERIVRVLFDDGSSVVTTKEHLFLTNSGWKQAWLLLPEEILLPDLLQSGHWQQGTKSRDRDRRQDAQIEKDYRERCQKRGVLGAIRVARVEVYQRGYNESSFVGIISDKDRDRGLVDFFDLEVEGHPSYFANGVAVHNCHGVSRDGQRSLLKILEDTPSHCYFMLATTDPEKMITTIRTRCTEIKLCALSPECLSGLLKSIVTKEKARVGEEVITKIIECSDGSAREAVKLLDSVIGIKTDGERVHAITPPEVQRMGFDIAKALFEQNPSWLKVREIIKGVRGAKEDAEKIRHIVLGYANTVLLNATGKKAERAAQVLSRFECNFFDSKLAGLSLACWSVVADRS